MGNLSRIVVNFSLFPSFSTLSFLNSWIDHVYTKHQNLVTKVHGTMTMATTYT